MSEAATASTTTTSTDSVKNDIRRSAILDGKFFRVTSVSYDGNIKAACTTCPDGKKPLSGAIESTTNFLNHLKVSYYNYALKLVLKITWFKLLPVQTTKFKHVPTPKFFILSHSK
jgi:hypothetical protein